MLCGVFISLGVLCLFGTALAAFFLKDGIIGRVGEPPRVDGLSDGFKIDRINREIASKERDIEIEKKSIDWDEFRNEAERVAKLTNKNVAINENTSNVRESKAAAIKKLEDERRRLIAERDELSGKSQAKSVKPRTWEEFFEDYGFDLFLPAVLPLGLFSLFLATFVFGGRLPKRNPLSLTDFERRSLLFIAFSIVFSAFGFFLFVWILTLVY